MIFRKICAVVLCLFTLFGITAGAVSAPDSEEQNTVGEINPSTWAAEDLPLCSTAQPRAKQKSRTITVTASLISSM